MQWLIQCHNHFEFTFTSLDTIEDKIIGCPRVFSSLRRKIGLPKTKRREKKLNSCHTVRNGMKQVGSMYWFDDQARWRLIHFGRYIGNVCHTNHVSPYIVEIHTKPNGLFWAYKIKAPSSPSFAHSLSHSSLLLKLFDLPKQWLVENLLFWI